MLGNATFSFDDVAIVSVEACDAPEVVTSAEIDELCEREGLLQKLGHIGAEHAESTAALDDKVRARALKPPAALEASPPAHACV